MIKTLDISHKKFSWHKILFHNNKINRNLKVVKILSYKGSNRNTNCSFSICCSIDTTYYIINVIQKISSYISDILYNNKYNVTKYITEYNKPFVNSTNPDYFTITYKHPSVSYIMEVINISPLPCITCEMLNNVSPNINRSLYMLQSMAHIKLYESYESSQFLITCYKENFRVAIFVFLFNIFRNLNFFKNYTDYAKLKNYVFDKIRNIEITYFKNHGELQKSILYVDYLINEYEENNIVFDNSPSNPFICIRSRYYEINNETTFKLIVWHASAITIKDIKSFFNIIDRLEYVYVNKLYEVNRKNIFDWSTLNEKLIAYIYSDTATNFKIEEYIDNYLFNISCLFKNETFFGKMNEYITKILNILNKKYFDRELYALFHNPTVTTMNSLHIQIYDKKTSGHSSFSSINTLGYMNSYMHEYSKYYFIDYTKISYNEWKQNHPYIILIPCTQKMKLKLNKYSVIYKGKKCLFKDIILDILFDNKITDDTYNLVVDFMNECASENPSEETIYNYVYDSFRKYTKGIYKNLLQYKNNMIIFLRNLYTISY